MEDPFQGFNLARSRRYLIGMVLVPQSQMPRFQEITTIMENQNQEQHHSRQGKMIRDGVSSWLSLRSLEGLRLRNFSPGHLHVD